MNEKMYTDIDHKIKITIESFGTMERLSLERGQNGIAHTTFANLAWGCEVDMSRTATNDVESFIAPREKIAEVVRSFRAMNNKQQRRGQGLWKQSPFIFRHIGQQGTYYKDLNIVPYRYSKPSFLGTHLKEEGF